MMIHPSFDWLRAFGTAESTGAVQQAINTHLSDCHDCRQTVQWFRDVRGEASALTLLPAPAGSWERIAERVRAGEVVLLPTESTAGEKASNSRTIRRAAIGLMLLVGAAAAAMQGPALRRWAERLFTRESAAPVQPLPVEPEAPAETVLLVEPYEDRVVLVLEQPRASLRIHVRFTDASTVEVRGRGAAANAQFRSAAGRLTIVQAAGGELDVTIPHTLAVMRIEVDGAAYLTKQGRQIRILAPLADTVGSEIILPVVR